MFATLPQQSQTYHLLSTLGMAVAGVAGGLVVRWVNRRRRQSRVPDQTDFTEAELDNMLLDGRLTDEEYHAIRRSKR